MTKYPIGFTITIDNEEHFVDSTQKAKALKELVERLAPEGPKAEWARMKKAATMVKHTAPKKGEVLMCPVCEESYKRGEIPGHVRGFHDIQRG